MMYSVSYSRMHVLFNISYGEVGVCTHAYRGTLLFVNVYAYMNDAAIVRSNIVSTILMPRNGDVICRMVAYFLCIADAYFLMGAMILAHIFMMTYNRKCA